MVLGVLMSRENFRLTYVCYMVLKLLVGPIILRSGYPRARRVGRRSNILLFAIFVFVPEGRRLLFDKKLFVPASKSYISRFFIHNVQLGWQA